MNDGSEAAKPVKATFRFRQRTKVTVAILAGATVLVTCAVVIFAGRTSDPTVAGWHVYRVKPRIDWFERLLAAPAVSAPAESLASGPLKETPIQAGDLANGCSLCWTRRPLNSGSDPLGAERQLGPVSRHPATESVRVGDATVKVSRVLVFRHLPKFRLLGACDAAGHPVPVSAAELADYATTCHGATPTWAVSNVTTGFMYISSSEYAGVRMSPYSVWVEFEDFGAPTLMHLPVLKDGRTGYVTRPATGVVSSAKRIGFPIFSYDSDRLLLAFGLVAPPWAEAQVDPASEAEVVLGEAKYRKLGHLPDAVFDAAYSGERPWRSYDGCSGVLLKYDTAMSTFVWSVSAGEEGRAMCRGAAMEEWEGVLVISRPNRESSAPVTLRRMSASRRLVLSLPQVPLEPADRQPADLLDREVDVALLKANKASVDAVFGFKSDVDFAHLPEPCGVMTVRALMAAGYAEKMAAGYAVTVDENTGEFTEVPGWRLRMAWYWNGLKEHFAYAKFYVSQWWDR